MGKGPVGGAAAPSLRLVLRVLVSIYLTHFAPVGSILYSVGSSYVFVYWIQCHGESACKSFLLPLFPQLEFSVAPRQVLSRKGLFPISHEDHGEKNVLESQVVQRVVPSRRGGGLPVCSVECLFIAGCEGGSN